MAQRFLFVLAQIVHVEGYLVQGEASEDYDATSQKPVRQ
jgi:hypothetical protein